MVIKINANIKNPPVGGIAAAYLIKNKIPVEIEWNNDANSITTEKRKFICHSNNDILRTLARLAPDYKLFYDQNATAIEKTKIDHWLTFCLTWASDLTKSLEYLEKSVASVTYLVGNRLTIADLALYNEIYLFYNVLANQQNNTIPVHVKRWFDLINSQQWIQDAINSFPDNVRAAIEQKRSSLDYLLGDNIEACEKPQSRQQQQETKLGERKQEGKFVDLPGAEMGKVIVRFPPEASGYLHIGHAKAALLNQYYQQAFQGKLIMRFDDTNPAKENVEFEKVILEDLEMLQIKPDLFTHTSQYFDLMLDYCKTLIEAGKAYIDDTDAETMKREREQRIESVNRNNPVSKNLQLWEEMLKGSEIGQKCCVRAKIDMSSDNGCMRDPTIYRCKNEPHPRTGYKYKVYPTYDFACPIVDAIENVTHTLRTMEYHDRDEQFYWFIDALKLRKPVIWEFSRLNMTNTVLSKRKLTWFVENGLVDGWDDPRFPTVRGILRRGMTVEGLKEFIIAQGSSKSVVFMNWDKIWAFNKKVIDPIAPRYTALEKDNHVVVNVAHAKKDTLIVSAHPKNESVGKKTIWVGPRILIDYVDAEALKEGENATFINWGNLMINKIHKDIETGKITSIDASLNLENKDFKKTMKLTWLCELDQSEYPPTYCVYFDHIISKPVLAKDEDFKQYIGHKTRNEVQILADPELKKCKKGDIIQLQRRGFFKVDNAYSPPSLQSGCESPIVLFAIPDGHTKEMPVSGAKNSSTTTTTSIRNAVESVTSTTSSSADDLDNQIKSQGIIVRDLKSKKASKDQIDIEVKKLLSLKADYKSLTSQDWKPSSVSTKNESTAITDPLQLYEQIKKQGDIVRDLKTKKASKDDIDSQVKVLLSLKTNYKTLTGTDWKPDAQPQPINKKLDTQTVTDPLQLHEQIKKQGDIVRDLKTKKASKDDIDSQVKVLLSLKTNYKTLTGTDWKPDAQPQPINKKLDTSDAVTDLTCKISKQGDKVRQLKTAKSDKSIVDAEVKILLELKNEFKNLTGNHWKPSQMTSVTSAAAAKTKSPSPASEIKVLNSNADEKETFTKRITEQGDVVRKLKHDKAAKDVIDNQLKILLDLKEKYKELFGENFPNPTKASGKDSKGKKEIHSSKIKENKSLSPPNDAGKAVSGNVKKQTRLGLEATKEDNLPEWYSQVITKGELIEYYDVSGCYILRHWSFAIWKAIKNWFEAEITKLGVKECYFPIFVSRSVLEREKTHIADFAPEVAWVTKSGETDLAEHIAIRPTSETVMYPAYSKWVQSYRDLPIKLNQWNNVVRWEFKHPQPFLRTREFLWQEGHTAFATKKEAEEEVLQILELYAKVYTHLLAIPVIKGRKTEKEKFAGGDYTTTVEAFISASGRAIQGATSHHLGQNFSKMFDIVFEDPETQTKQYVYQNSWGLTTRTIGVMIMVHADNQGLVLPPHVASIQCIIVPCGITANMKDDEKEQLMQCCKNLEEMLQKADIRVEGDYRDNYSPGWKFNHWELKGVPIRIEIGPKDMKFDQMVAVRRDTGEKLILSCDNAGVKISQLLETIHESMFAKAKQDLSDHTKIAKNWNDFCKYLNTKNIIMSPFCGETPCEDKIKADSANDEDAEPGAPSMGAKSLCIPFDQPAIITSNDKCIYPACRNKPKFYTLFGRSY